MYDVVVYEREKEWRADDASRAANWLSDENIRSVTIYRVSGNGFQPVEYDEPSPVGDTGSVPFDFESLTDEQKRQLVVEAGSEHLQELKESATVDKNIRGHLVRFRRDAVPTEKNVADLKQFLRSADSSDKDAIDRFKLVCVWPGNGAITALVAILQKEDAFCDVFTITETPELLLGENVSERIVAGNAAELAAAMKTEEVDAVIFGDGTPEKDEDQVRDIEAWQARVKDRDKKRMFFVNWG